MHRTSITVALLDASSSNTHPRRARLGGLHRPPTAVRARPLGQARLDRQLAARRRGRGRARPAPSRCRCVGTWTQHSDAPMRRRHAVLVGVRLGADHVEPVQRQHAGDPAERARARRGTRRRSGRRSCARGARRSPSVPASRRRGTASRSPPRRRRHRTRASPGPRDRRRAPPSTRPTPTGRWPCESAIGERVQQVEHVLVADGRRRRTAIVAGSARSRRTATSGSSRW